jgi:hypothetical protein
VIYFKILAFSQVLIEHLALISSCVRTFEIFFGFPLWMMDKPN